MRSLGMRSSKVRLALAAVAVTVLGLVGGFGPAPGGASSHREAPLVSADPQVDGTDLYAFMSPDQPGTVTIITDWLPFEEPAGGPNFYALAPGVNYDVKIDNDGDARPDVIYRWRFRNHRRNPNTFLYNTGPVTSLTDPDLNFYQTYDLYRIVVGRSVRRVVHDARVVPVNVGAASMPNYPALFAAGVRSAGCARCRTWVGQADDPFFLDLRVFDLLYGANFKEVGDDTLAGFNVHAMALQVPKSELLTGGDRSGIVGIWTTASRPSTRVQAADGSQVFRGPLVQVSRLGMPLVNEVVVPVGKKDLFNGSSPRQDAQFLPSVLDPELPRLISAVYGSVFPTVPDCTPGGPVNRNCDLVPVFLTGVPGLNRPPSVRPGEMLRLNTGIAPCSTGCSPLGVLGGDTAGFPNGRRLSDDVVDIALRVMMGALIPGHDPDADTLGDGVNANDVPFQASFPYLALPHSGSDASPHPATAFRA